MNPDFSIVNLITRIEKNMVYTYSGYIGIINVKTKTIGIPGYTYKMNLSDEEIEYLKLKWIL